MPNIAWPTAITRSTCARVSCALRAKSSNRTCEGSSAANVGPSRNSSDTATSSARAIAINVSYDGLRSPRSSNDAKLTEIPQRNANASCVRRCDSLNERTLRPSAARCACASSADEDSLTRSSPRGSRGRCPACRRCPSSSTCTRCCRSTSPSPCRSARCPRSGCWWCSAGNSCPGRSRR